MATGIGQLRGVKAWSAASPAPITAATANTRVAGMRPFTSAYPAAPAIVPPAGMRNSERCSQAPNASISRKAAASSARWRRAEAVIENFAGNVGLMLPEMKYTAALAMAASTISPWTSPRTNWRNGSVKT
jgi:hypothetical protein